MIEEMALQEAKREQQRSQNTYSKSSNSSSFDDLTCCLLCWVHILHEISQLLSSKQGHMHHGAITRFWYCFSLVSLLMAATSDNSTTSELL